MILNAPGLMVHLTWLELPMYYKDIRLDAFQLMPNHFHGIIKVIRVKGNYCQCSAESGVEDEKLSLMDYIQI
jgi:hypothetical protein